MFLVLFCFLISLCIILFSFSRYFVNHLSSLIALSLFFSHPFLVNPFALAGHVVDTRTCAYRARFNGLSDLPTSHLNASSNKFFLSYFIFVATIYDLQAEGWIWLSVIACSSGWTMACSIKDLISIYNYFLNFFHD